MNVGIFSSLEWIFPDTKPANSSIDISVCKGSYVNAQIVIDNCNGKIIPEVVFSDGLNLNAYWYQLLEVNVNRNSDFYEPLDDYNRPIEVLEKLFTRKAPFKVYDPMLPLEKDTVFKDKAVLYVSFKIPIEQEAGDYNINLRICCGNESAEVFIALKIYDITIPEKKSLNVVNWIHPVENAYDFKWMDEKCWNLLEKIGRLAQRSGQNCVSLSNMFFACKFENGSYIFDFSNAEKYINMLFNMGYDRIEGPHIVAIYNRFMKPRENADVYSERGIECLTAFLKQWYTFLKEKGWEKITMQHIGDEPKGKDVDNYILLAKLVKKCMPNSSIIEAVLTPDVCEYIDIPVPITRHYQQHKTEYNKSCENAKEIWLYTCCWPVAPYFNRFLDMPLISPRLVHWLNYKTNTVGYLHWGFCTQGENQNVYEEPSIAFKYMGVPDSDQFLPAGDTNIIYPYKGEPIGSVRLEMVRAGVEDYELLKMLEKKDKNAARKFVDLVVNDDWHTEFNYQEFEGIYDCLLKTIEE